jgi:hypothetical protein
MSDAHLPADLRNRASTRLALWVWSVAAGVVVFGAAFYVWILGTRPEKAFFWALMGDSVGPFAALLSAAALFAALYSVGLQRHELELQRAELRETREEMKAQREQFERTAKAQEALAHAQDAANSLAPFQELAVRRLTEATLFQVLLRADLAKDEYEPPEVRDIGATLKGISEVVRVHMVEERLRIVDLERELAIARRDKWERT